MSELSLLEKLAAEVEKNDKGNSKPQGDKSGAGDKKPAGGKGFPPKNKSSNGGGESKDGGDGDKKDGKAAFFGKKTNPKNGEGQPNGNGSEGANNEVNEKENGEGGEPGKENKVGPGGEQEIEGNESAEGPAVPGTQAVNPTMIIDFFAQNPAPNDEAYHEFAESQGIDIHQAEAAAYALAGKYVMFLRGGKSGGGQIDLSQVDPDQLNKGIEVESEHTGDPVTAKKIALDHLVEFPDYYTRLAQMESSGGQVVAQPKDQNEQKNNPGQKGSEQKGEEPKDKEQKKPEQKK